VDVHTLYVCLCEWVDIRCVYLWVREIVLVGEYEWIYSVCVCVCMSVCVCVYVHVCACMCMCIHVCAYVCV